MTGFLVAIGAVAMLASAAASLAMLRFARRRLILDHPSERSSHTEPTPRGGGLGFVLVVIAGIVLLEGLGWVDQRFAMALLGGGVLVAAAGWLDDLHSLSPALRFAAHVAAAAWAVGWLGGMPTLSLGPVTLATGAGGGLLAVAGIVWAINFYNFMDGIDGLAASEAAVVGTVGAALVAGSDPALAVAAALVGGAAAGFLPVNWAPARVFMGDVGSGFLGFAFGTLALASENTAALPALIWLLLLGVFFADTTVTLFRRILRGERWYAAHRTHAYQRAVQTGWSHAQVATAVLAADAALALLAIGAAHRPDRLPHALLAATVLLVGLHVLVERRRPMSHDAAAGRMEKPL